MREIMNLIADDVRLNERADVTSARFIDWFGRSKVVDNEGRPLQCFHGTSAGGFETFRPMSRFGTVNATGQWTVNAPDRPWHIRPVYLRIQHPYTVIDGGLEPGEQFFWWCETAIDQGLLGHIDMDAIYDAADHPQDYEFQNAHRIFVTGLSRRGYDGLTYINTEEDVGHRSWVTFDSEQIWHAMLDEPDG